MIFKLTIAIDASVLEDECSVGHEMTLDLSSGMYLEASEIIPIWWKWGNWTSKIDEPKISILQNIRTSDYLFFAKN